MSFELQQLSILIFRSYTIDNCIMTEEMLYEIVTSILSVHNFIVTLCNVSVPLDLLQAYNDKEILHKTDNTKCS